MARAGRHIPAPVAPFTTAREAPDIRDPEARFTTARGDLHTMALAALPTTDPAVLAIPAPVAPATAVRGADETALGSVNNKQADFGVAVNASRQISRAGKPQQKEAQKRELARGRHRCPQFISGCCLSERVEDGKAAVLWPATRRIERRAKKQLGRNLCASLEL